MYFLTRELDSWKAIDYRRNRFVEPNGQVHDETRPAEITVTSDKSSLGLGMCIIGSTLFLAASILLTSDKNEKV